MHDLTDSYCERCGARYAFDANGPKGLSLKGARVLAKGLKNFVMTDGQSMADAMSLARNEDDHQNSSRMTEAFHRTFNFCMTCRQYACDGCWNSKVGACLSCSPEAGFGPVAPEDHLIVRTPVARWDTDWSLFPNGPAVEPLARPDPPAPFNEPIRFPDPQPVLPTDPPVAEAWPQIDLPTDLPPATPARARKSGHRPSQRSADPNAASLWPIADEIAPEMTLTAEEMDIVESSLGQGDASRDLAAAPVPEPAPATAQAPAAAPAPVPEPDLLDALLKSSSRRRATPENVVPPAAQTPIGATSVAPSTPAQEPAQPLAQQPEAQQPVALEPDVQPEVQVPPGRILRMTMTGPSLPPLVRPAPQPESHEHAAFIARLLGRSSAPSDNAASAKPRRAPAGRGKPSGDPWPHVTTWSERPIEFHDWQAETDSSAGDVAAEPAAAPAVPSPAPARPIAQQPQPLAPTEPPAAGRTSAPPGSARPDVDARSSAEVRLSAVAGVGVPPAPVDDVPAEAAAHDWSAVPAQSAPAQPATRPPLFDGSVPEQDRRQSAGQGLPAWPKIDPDLSDVKRRHPSEAPDRTQVRLPDVVPAAPQAPAEIPAPRSELPNPWPPLGASWPAQRDTAGPWPGPDAPPIPTLVAAQGIGPPVLAEMWAQSSEEVLNRGTVRVCHRCALPVSTQARFCRRCGTRQG
jgi:ribosomal protein L40E